MGRSPSNNNSDNIIELKKGPWTPEEDEKLVDYIQKHGQGSWQLLPKKAGINRCGKSCRLRWTNYLRPDIKRGNFSPEEEQAIIDLHSILGNKWSMIATHLPGRTDNEIKNFWNTHIRKKLLQSGIDPQTHLPIITTHDYNNNNIPLNLLLMNILPAAPFTLPLPTPNLNNLIMNPPLENLAKIRLLHDILLLLKTNVINAAPNFSSQYDLNKIEGFNTGILLNNVNTSSMVPNLEYINNLDSNSFQPVSDTFMTIPEIACAQNKAIFNSSNSNSNSDTTSEFSLPALLSPEFCCSGKQVDHYYGNYDQMFMDNCNNAADTCLGTLKDTNEASTSTSNSFWKDIFIE